MDETITTSAPAREPDEHTQAVAEQVEAEAMEQAVAAEEAEAADAAAAAEDAKPAEEAEAADAAATMQETEAADAAETVLAAEAGETLEAAERVEAAQAAAAQAALPPETTDEAETTGAVEAAGHELEEEAEEAKVEEMETLIETGAAGLPSVFRDGPAETEGELDEMEELPELISTTLAPEPVSTKAEGVNGTAARVKNSAAAAYPQEAHRDMDTGPLQWDEGAAVVVESKDGQEQTLFFPNGFLWGTATSAYQIEGAAAEGGRSPSIWDTFSETPGRVKNGDTGEIACDHYHLWKEDVQLMRELDFQAYRFSISWSRLLPEGRGEVNLEAVSFYSGLIDELLANDIQPWVTIYHWDLPQCLEDEYGGWLDRQVIEDFENYAVACFSLFGDRVFNWITFNEPWCSAVLGYANGEMAPGRDHEPEREPYLVAHHIILAHAKAVHRYRAEFQDKSPKDWQWQKGQIGITLNMDWKEALTESISDCEAQGRSLDWQLGWFADPIWHGDYPRTMRRRLGSRLPSFTAEEKKLIKNTSDFFGLNHYSTKYVSARPGRLKASPDEVEEEGGYFDDPEVRDKDDPRWTLTAMGWPVVPWGLKKLCELIQSEYAPKGGIYVTENGCAARGEGEYIVSTKPDTFRVDYFKGYLAQLHKAIQCGADVRGYFAWSFMDNFEWHHGYSKRFGIVHVNYKTQVRTPKASANFISQASRMNAVQISTSLLDSSDFRPLEDLGNSRERLETIRSQLNATRNSIMELKMEGCLNGEDQSLVDEIAEEADVTTAAIRDLKAAQFFVSLGVNGALYYDCDAFAEDNAYEHKFDSRSSFEDAIMFGVDMCKTTMCGGFCIFDSTLYFRRHSPDLIEKRRVSMPGCTLVVVRHDGQEEDELTTWTVVGANGPQGKKGIWVRRGEDPTSALLGQLTVGSKIREMQAIGQRLQYQLLEGDGPDFGWVSIKVGQTDVLVRDD
mmetsp:Transcript_81382/g.141236  ORF Transcript_81382/g.141236 Transcript_81382/m.141236 type:complete len:960 (-) Transcript_81382:35-2914(-)